MGSAAHALDLLIEDVEKIGSFASIVKMSKVLVYSIKNNAVALSHFRRYQKEQQQRTGERPKALTVPPNTRFAYVAEMFESIIHNKEPIQQSVLLRDHDFDRKVKNIAMDDDHYWPRIEAYWYNVMKPMKKAITMIEADNALLSDVVEAFHCIKVGSIGALRDSPLKKYERRLSRIISDRKSFIMHDIHLASNMLDPRCKGKNLTSEEKIRATDYITELCADLSLDSDKVLKDLADWKTNSGYYSREALMRSAQITEPPIWWRAHGEDRPLSPIASRLCLLPPTTANCERVWSGFGRSHTKVRNKLKNKKLTKEVSIQMNLRFTEHGHLKKKKEKEELTNLQT